MTRRPTRHTLLATTLVTSLVTSLAALLAAPAGAVRAQPPSVERLAWLAGCWERRSGARLVEEQWMRPRGGTLLGASRTTRGDTLVEWEQLRIATERGTLVLHAQPSGQPAAAFRLATLDDSAATFADPAHDFPQRIAYRRVGDTALVARIDGTVGGRPRAVAFPYRRVSCPR